MNAPPWLPSGILRRHKSGLPTLGPTSTLASLATPPRRGNLERFPARLSCFHPSYTVISRSGPTWCLLSPLEPPGRLRGLVVLSGFGGLVLQRRTVTRMEKVCDCRGVRLTPLPQVCPFLPILSSCFRIAESAGPPVRMKPLRDQKKRSRLCSLRLMDLVAQ